MVHSDGEIKKQLILPSPLIPDILQSFHNDVGHQGKDRTLSLLRDRFYWPGMTKDVQEWITHCGRCLRRKSPTNHRAPLVNIKTSAPLELVCIDYLTLEPSQGGQQNILVITDHFTRFAQAIPTRNQTARTTAEALYNNFIVHYGLPERIHSDQGANFESKLIKELCELMGTKKSRTTSYHPQGNGMCERFNRTLLSMLGTLENDQKRNWKKYVSPLVFFYNSTKHDSTGCSPYVLMFGRDPRLPVDITLGLRKHAKETDYISDLRDRLEYAHQKATEMSQKSQEKQKEGYDIKAKGATLQKGDKVLVKINAFDGKHKLSDKWEQDVYIITDQPNPDIPVFTVRKENGGGRKRNLHRNLLLPVEYISENWNTQENQKPDRKKPVVRRSRPAETDVQQEESSDEETDILFIHPDVDNGSISDVTADTLQQEEQEGITEDTAESEGALSQTTEVDGTDSESTVTREDDADPVEIQEDEPEDASSSASSPFSSPPEVRRSTRQRKPPAWMQSNEFDLNQTVNASLQDKDWYQKVQCVTSLSKMKLFKEFSILWV